MDREGFIFSEGAAWHIGMLGAQRSAARSQVQSRGWDTVKDHSEGRLSPGMRQRRRGTPLRAENSEVPLQDRCHLRGKVFAGQLPITARVLAQRATCREGDIEVGRSRGVGQGVD